MERDPRPGASLVEFSVATPMVYARTLTSTPATSIRLREASAQQPHHTAAEKSRTVPGEAGLLY